ncbi:hypothetical protein [Klebsiella pneumoniae]|nr:hypothetical protein [Klebsiella pneumoniae]MBC5481305.1 hypothetical protein [Klebsiella pneumoniae]MBR7357919.1 hypothetical protein [Klebsiella pneumoniae]MBZ1557055.1 hypothetical protein [Klebsiella pneumoniae]MBZ6598971.1 hypothetical protein [Klebsiella pneumoniae]MCE0115901.1 hypothetical protein [Klebsiella pneumoniae]
MNKVTHLVLPLSLISTDVLAENKTETVPITEKQTSDTIVVRAAPTSQSMGTQIINADKIASRPTGNGTVTELLKYNPNVRFANDSNSSLNPGEIAPENVSFHGEKFYNSNFIIPHGGN